MDYIAVRKSEMPASAFASWLRCEICSRDAQIDDVLARLGSASSVARPSLAAPGDDAMRRRRTRRACEHPGGCDTMPCFSVPGDVRGTFCRAHKLDGMIDVVNKRKRIA